MARIGLIKKLPTGKSDTTIVEAGNVAELQSALSQHGIKAAALYSRDRIGEGKIESRFIPVADLDVAHYAWIAEHPASVVRGLFYES